MENNPLKRKIPWFLIGLGILVLSLLYIFWPQPKPEPNVENERIKQLELQLQFRNKQLDSTIQKLKEKDSAYQRQLDEISIKQTTRKKDYEKLDRIDTVGSDELYRLYTEF